MAKRSNESLSKLPDLDDGSVIGFNLSLVSQDDPKNLRLDALLQEAHALKAAEGRLKVVKQIISDRVQGAGLSDGEGHLGARLGSLCCIVRWQAGRKTFNRELAIEAGITPDQIEASMKEGEGNFVCELPSMEE